jgi:hypothetical protein
MTRYDERAERGAQLLDLTAPGWHEQIDLDELNIRFRSQCVLAQTYGSYGAGTSALAIDDYKAESYGFWVTSPLTHLLLKRAWKREVTARREDCSLLSWTDEIADFQAAQTVEREPVSV